VALVVVGKENEFQFSPWTGGSRCWLHLLVCVTAPRQSDRGSDWAFAWWP
jgi:hypothetical protein